MDYIPPEPIYQPPPKYLVGRLIADGERYFGCCPFAMTMTCFSHAKNRSVLFILTCRRWSCRTCADQKIKRLAIDVREAKPNRLLTLTVDPALHSSPKQAWEDTRRKVSVLIRTLRKRFGDIEYMRVTEVTKKGWPHYHLLVRSGYLPQPVVKAEWEKLTGATIVDLRQVKKSFAAYNYLVKYLSKLHNLGWTERHVSLSRRFTPKRKSSQVDELVCGDATIWHQHPASYSAANLEGQTLLRLSTGCYEIIPLVEFDPFSPPVEKTPVNSFDFT